MGTKKRWLTNLRALPVREKIAFIFAAAIVCSLIMLLLFLGQVGDQTSSISSTAYACGIPTPTPTPTPTPAPIYDIRNPDYTGDYPERYKIKYVHYE